MNTRLISKYLQLLRKKHAFTQEDLARELGISRQAVSKWETGNTVPDLEALLKLSRLYDRSINDLLEPKIPPVIIEDFEQLTGLPETALKDILESLPPNDIVKASMGASPTVNKFLAKLLPDLDFVKMQMEIGRIRITDIESAQQEITALVNLEISPTEKQKSGR